jgi:hypothetical protein
VPPSTRIVALGASNLTRGFQAVVSAARRRWGADVEIVAALGHGRSYGAESRFVLRSVPGILQSGLWRELEKTPDAPTRALVTDVGNDVLYGYSASQTLAWVEECVDRLQSKAAEVVLTDLPLSSIRTLSSARFLFFRSLFVPSCRLSLAQVADTAERVTAGLAALAAARGLRFVRLRPEWYGVDPIHIRPALWRAAWQEILCGDAEAGENGDRSVSEALRLYLMRPERQRLFGIEMHAPQTGRRLPRGASVKLF